MSLHPNCRCILDRRTFQQYIDGANFGSRVHKLEQQIGAGLIEEIIDVAEGELQLIDTMEKSKV